MIPVLLLVRAQGGMAAIRIVDPRGQLMRALLFVGTSVVFVLQPERAAAAAGHGAVLSCRRSS